MLATQKESVQPPTDFVAKPVGPKLLYWKDVFNSSHKHWGYITYAREAAEKAAYPYFAWNSRIYVTIGGADTGFTEWDVL